MTARELSDAIITFKERCNVLYRNSREIKLSVKLPNKKEIRLGPYRRDDSDNIKEIAKIVVGCLTDYQFKGRIIIDPLASSTRQHSSNIFPELLQSEIRERYSYGEIKVKQPHINRR